MEFSADLTGAAWIAPRLGSFGTVGGLVPTGYDAYVRISHPDLEGWLDGDRLARLVRLLTPASSAPGVTVGIWEGWGLLHPESMSVFSWPAPSAAELIELNRRYRAERAAAIDPRLAKALTGGRHLLRTPQRRYALLVGQLSELTDPDWGFGAAIGWHGDDQSPGPQLVWPDDHAWFVGSDTDLDFSVVGCSRRAAGAVLASTALETREVTADDLLAPREAWSPPAASP